MKEDFTYELVQKLLSLQKTLRPCNALLKDVSVRIITQKLNLLVRSPMGETLEEAETKHVVNLSKVLNLKKLEDLLLSMQTEVNSIVDMFQELRNELKDKSEQDDA